MKTIEKLVQGKYYHVFTHAVSKDNFYKNNDDYLHFLKLYDVYISPIADTYSFVLMPNHFHLLVKIKENVVYKNSGFDKFSENTFSKEEKWQTIDIDDYEELPNQIRKTPQPHLHFSHFFNAYGKYFNKKYSRRGVLFEKRFERKCIKSLIHFQNIVLYIHHNPVHHGFVSHPMEYPWSSYLSCISVKPTKLKRDTVIGWFDNLANFKLLHDQDFDCGKIDDWLFS